MTLFNMKLWLVAEDTKSKKRRVVSRLEKFYYSTKKM